MIKQILQPLRHCERGGVYLLGWVFVSLTPSIPLLLGQEFDMEYALQTGVFHWSREWLARLATLGFGIALPMTVHFFAHDKCFTDNYWFWNRLVLLLSLYLGGAVTLAAVGLEVEDATLGAISITVMMVQANLVRGAILGSLYGSDAPVRIQKTSTIYFIGSALSFYPRVMNYYSYDWTRDTIFSTLDIVLQVLLTYESFQALKKEDSDESVPTDVVFGVYCTLCSLLGIVIFIVAYAVIGAIVPGHVILFSYVQTMLGFTLAGRQNKQETNRITDLLDVKRSFTRYIAHEMRTPLNVSAIGLKLAQEQVAKRNPQAIDRFKFPVLAEILEDSAKAVEEAADTLDEMLIYDKVENGNFEIETERLEVSSLIKVVFRSFFPQAQAKGVVYSLDIAANVNDVFIRADRKKITQAIRNYISNALKFTAENGNVIVKAYCLPQDTKLTDEASIPGCTVHVEVVDTGVGIAARNLTRVFNEVVQFNAAKHQNGGGSGLGLTITKAILDAHDGTVGVTSEEGVGSTFYFELEGEVCPSGDNGTLLSCPVSFSESGASSTDNDEPDLLDDDVNVSIPFVSTSQKSSDVLLRVLVVDDSKLNVKMMSRLVQPYASDVQIAPNGRIAAEIIEASLSGDTAHPPFDLVLTDYFMPELDGVKLTSRVRAAGYNGFVALVTGVSEDNNDVINNFHDNGGNMLLSKPIRSGDMARLIVLCVEDVANRAK